MNAVNVAILNRSLKYICNNFKLVICLAQWMYQELRIINYDDRKLQRLLSDDELEAAESIVDLVKNKPILNTSIHYALDCGADINIHLRFLDKCYKSRKDYSNRILLCGARYDRIDLVQQTLEQYPNEQYEFKLALRYASAGGCINIVKLLLPRISCSDLEHAVMFGIVDASDNGHIEIVKLLLELGFNTCYYRAVIEACRSEHIEIVKLLLNHKVDLNLDIYNESMFASIRNNNIDIVKLLLDYGVKITGEMLNIAFENKSFDIVKLIASRL